MMSDTVADMLTRIRNAVADGKETVEMPASKFKANIAEALQREGFIEDSRVAGNEPKKTLKIYLKYGPRGEKVIRHIQRVSKPGRRIYRSADDLPYVENGLGIVVVSTSRGVLSDRECRQKHVGGEVLCSVA